MEPVRVIADDLVLVDWGPMTLTVSVWLKGKARPVMAAKAGRASLTFLSDLADFKKLMSKEQAGLPRPVPSRPRPLPLVVETAVRAVRAVDPSLTPMAAVAGATAQEVCRVAVDLGADRVIVNNGGDIALYLSGKAKAVVGLRPPGQESLFGRLILEPGSGIGGVATSGWEGRSHSPGVADLVSVWADSAALADAAATLIAGACDVANPEIEKKQASELDPQTDLGRKMVTVKVGRLDGTERETALNKGMAAATRLNESGIIRGCLIDVQGTRAELDPDSILEIL